MSVLNNQPNTFNFFNPERFKFSIKRAPNTVFFVTGVNLPGIILSVNEHHNPLVTLPIPGEKIDFQEFNLRFKVDEDFNNYLEMFNWMIKLGFPREYEQFASIRDKNFTTGEGEYSDATLTLLTSKRNSNIAVTFHNMFPTSISDIDMTLEKDDVETSDCTVTFRYDKFEVDVI